MVDKIIVHTPDKSSGHRKQKIEIYYKAVGIINIADDECVALDGRLGMKNHKKKTQPNSAKWRHSFRCTATLHKYFVIAPRLSMMSFFIKFKINMF